MRRSALVRHGAVVLGLVATTVPVVTWAQEEPLVVSQRETLEWIGFTDLDAAVEGYWRRAADEVSNGVDERDVEDRYEVSLELGTEGYIGHPNLLELKLLGSVGFRRENFDFDSAPGVSDRDRVITRYDVSGLFLKEGRLPIELYTRREDRSIDREFSGSLDNTLQEYGIRLRYRSDFAPTFIHYFHREQDQTDALGRSDLDLIEDTFKIQNQLNLGPQHRLNVDYRFDHIRQSGSSRTDRNFDRHDGTATHTLNFGDQRENQQRAQLRLFRETGDFAVDRLRFDETLRLVQNRWFRTRFDYTLDHQERPDSRQNFQIGSVGFTHQVFESLLTNGDAGLSKLTLSEDDFTSRQIFGRLTSDYTKYVPGGQLFAGLALAAAYTDDSDRGSDILIQDEPRVFGVSGIIILDRRNIVDGSLRITNVTGTIIYDEGVDYIARTLPDRTEVRRIVGGDIAVGQPLLFDYLIGPEPASTTTTTGLGGNVRYEIGVGLLTGLAFHLDYRQQNEDRDTIAPLLAPANDFTLLAYGIDYRRGPVIIRTVREERNGTISPFDAYRFEGRFVQTFGRGNVLSFNADYDEIHFTDTDSDARILVLTVWRQRLTETLSGSARIIYRDEQVSDGVDVQGWEARLDLTWEYRQTTVYATARASLLESDINDTLAQTFIVGFRREF